MKPLLTWKGRRIRSASDSPEAAARKVPESLRPGSLFFIPSPLEGWGLPELLRRLPSESCVVLYEPDADLWEHCKEALNAALGESAKRVFLLSEDSEAAIQRLFAQLPLFVLRRCEFLSLNGAWLASAARTREVFARIDDGLVQWWANRATAMKLGSLWIRNLIDNSLALRTLRSWPDWENAPTIVCGAGVSLETSLEWIKQVRDRVQVLAVDTALGTLSQSGITPDGVVVVEAQWANLIDFLGTTPRGISLFADLTSLPAVPRLWSEGPYWFVSQFAELSLWDRIPRQLLRFPPLGSVGLYAVEVAWRLTRGPVILTGLDFSFPWGKSHASGSPSHQNLLRLASRVHPVEQLGTWPGPDRFPLHGGWATTRVLSRYARLLENRIGSQSDRTYIWGSPRLVNLPPWPPNAKFPVPTSKNTAGNEVSLDQTWIDKERALWDRLLDAFVRINAKVEVSWENELLPLLKALDYLWFDFPDPLPRRDSDWLSRAKVRVSAAKSRWGSA